LRQELRQLRARIQELLDRYPQFVQPRGRHVAAAILAVILFFGSWIVDFIVLSPLAEFMLDWANRPANNRIPIQIGFAFIWTLFGYGIGAELAIGLQSRQRSWWLFLFVGLAIIYAIAMPLVGYFVGAPVFEGPARWMLMPITLVLSGFPVLSGYFTTTGAEYLAFLIRMGWLKRSERSLERQVYNTGGELVLKSQGLAVAVNEHERRFGDRVQPYLTELAQRLIEEFSRGNITVTLDEPRPLPLAPPRPLPAAAGNGTAPEPERPTPQGVETPTSGNGAGVGAGDHAEADQTDAPETEYLRRQLAQRAEAEDAELTAPNGFATRLP
jgi:hypothetical protein